MAAPSVQQNPYIIGRPISQPKVFFGRERLLAFIQDNLEQQAKVILLHGQRRIGKTSVLCQIPHFVGQDQFVFVSFDLQDKGQLSLSKVLCSLAEEIVDQLELDAAKLALPSLTELEADIQCFAQHFLPQIHEAIDHKNLVLLLDEFDVLNNYDPNAAIDHFFPYLETTLRQQDYFFIIPVVGRRLDDLPRLLRLFRQAPNQEIGLLDDVSAQQLIVKPAEGVLKYDAEAIQAILELSAGHPYFTQIICHALFGKARSEQNWRITRTDVEGIVDRAIEFGEGGLAWFWDGLPIPERIVFLAVAKIQQGEEKPDITDHLALLETLGVVITETLMQARKRLVAWDFLLASDSDNTWQQNSHLSSKFPYTVKVELVRRWLIKRYSLRDQIWLLEKLDSKAESLYKKAVTLAKQDRKVDAAKLSDQVLGLNPNYLSAVFSSAKLYYELGDFQKSKELYSRAIRINPIRAQEEYEQVLLKEREDISSVPLLQSSPLTTENKAYLPRSFRSRRKKRLILPLLMGLGLVTSLLFFNYSLVAPIRSLTALPQDVNDSLQVRFSSGERLLLPQALFSSEGNLDRQLGATAFSDEKYLNAVDFFQQAREAAPNDHEALIYLNNAKARLRENPLVLAVVVSPDEMPDTTQEILRGVAQAQDQFNRERASKRLLEIVIANDSSNQLVAEDVAQRLAKSSTILGVIGHVTSDVTYAALPIYDEAGLAVISSTATSPLLSIPTKHTFFRTVPSDTEAGRVLADYAIGQNLNRIVVLYDSASLYSQSLHAAFTEHLMIRGGDKPIDIDLAELASEPTKQFITAVDKSNPQAILLIPSSQSTAIAIQAMRMVSLDDKSSAGERLTLLGGDILYSSTTLQDGGSAVEGLILAVPWFAEGRFADEAEKFWGGRVSWRTASSYDATQALIATFSNQVDRREVLQRLREVNLLPSETSGEGLRFSADGERMSQPVLVRVVAGGARPPGSNFSFEPLP